MGNEEEMLTSVHDWVHASITHLQGSPIRFLLREAYMSSRTVSLSL
jgi:hypothetical protein